MDTDTIITWSIIAVSIGVALVSAYIVFRRPLSTEKDTPNG